MSDVHHILREAEGKLYCLYCGQKHEMREWRSEIIGDKHYKTIKCRKCRKKSCIKVKFMGSGHDDWGKLEKKVMKEEKKG